MTLYRNLKQLWLIIRDILFILLIPHSLRLWPGTDWKDRREDDVVRMVFSTPFHPTLHALPSILRNLLPQFQKLDPTFDRLTSPSPIVAWCKTKTLKEKLSPSKFSLSEPQRSGNHKCAYGPCVTCRSIIECENYRINDKKRKVLGVNNCNSKWIVYGLCCTVCNLWYIGKTFTSFKERFSTHRSKIKRKMETGILTNTDTASEDQVHLWNHFVEKHKDMKSLKWVILHQIGKDTHDPAANLLRWEHAYIEHFNVRFPNGLNKRD